MNNWRKVMLWEIKRNITNKTFIISMLLTPVIMVIFGAIPSLLALIEAERLQTVYLVDELGVYEEIKANLPVNISVERFYGERAELKSLVKDSPDSSFIVLDETGVSMGLIPIFTAQEGIPELGTLQEALNVAIKEERFAKLGIDRQTTRSLVADLQFPVVSLRPEAEDPMARIIPAAFAGLILFSISITGSMTFQSSVQEKKDKMAELILSSITPHSMMQGKVLGYFTLGMIQAALWLIFAIPTAVIQFDIPVFDYLFVPILPVMLFFTIVGYLMFSALFASIGATIEDIQETGNFQGMIMFLPWLPFFFVGAIVSNPNGLIAMAASYFPLTSPGVMTMRLAMLSRIPVWDVLISGILLLLTTWLVIRLSGKIFKTGMLMYGKNASLKEIWKWVRY